jgi:Protein of unknown function (DUF616)
MKVVLYSALYGDYEAPKPLPDLGVQAIMYTDNQELEAPGWEVKYRPFLAVDASMMKAKYWKCHPHAAAPGAEVSLWVDASMTILVDDYVQQCLDALGDDDWAMVKHPGRDCIYDEANVSATMPKYNADHVQAQAEYYRSIGHPAHWGLFANGANVRRYNEAIRKLCDQWWYECSQRSWQDQVSLPVLVRLAGEDFKWNTNIPWHEWWHVGWH